MFRSRPSPFCVLDEVDAALDEANIDRFTSVLKDFLAWTQFIIVTHSKKTMTCANTIYGVTMQESGVSKQVSVRFEDVSDDGHIRPERLAEAEKEADEKAERDIRRLDEALLLFRERGRAFVLPFSFRERGSGWADETSKLLRPTLLRSEFLVGGDAFGGQGFPRFSRVHWRRSLTDTVENACWMVSSVAVLSRAKPASKLVKPPLECWRSNCL